MKIETAYELFIGNRAMNGITQGTLDQYTYTVKPMVKSLGSNIDMADAIADIQTYVTGLRTKVCKNGKTLSQGSVASHLKNIKAFMKFCREENFVEKFRMPPISWPKTEIKPLSQTQIRQILQSFDQKNFRGLRNYTLFRLLYDCGLRKNEARSLELEHIDMEGRFLFVHGKGGKNAWVPISSVMIAVLEKYLQARKMIQTDSEALFVTGAGEPITLSAISSMFTRLKKTFKFPGVRLSAHTLRHSFALAYIENGGDPFSLQSILRHSSQEMTAKYVHMAKGNLKAAHDRFAPTL